MRPPDPSDCDEVVRPGSFTVVDDAASAVVVALFASAEVFAAALVLSAAVDVRMSGWLTPAVSVNAGRPDLAAIAGEDNRGGQGRGGGPPKGWYLIRESCFCRTCLLLKRQTPRVQVPVISKPLKENLDNLSRVLDPDPGDEPSP